MVAIARAYTFTDGTDAYGSQVETEFSTVYNAWNNMDSGVSALTSPHITLGLFGDGTVGAPAFSFISDTNTGIYRIGADDIAISTGGIKALEIDAGQFVHQAGQASFLATSSGHSNVTGDGTNYSVVFETIVRNVASVYNATTGVFTAPRAGDYLLATNVGVVGWDANTTYYQLIIATTNRSYSTIVFPDLKDISVQTAGISGSLTVLADMAQGDTAVVTIVVAAGAKVTDLLANAQYNTFSGTLIN